MKNKIFGILLLMGMVLSGIALASADVGNGMGGMMYGMYGGFGTGMMLFSWLFGLLTTIALILLIVWLIKQIGKN